MKNDAQRCKNEVKEFHCIIFLYFGVIEESFQGGQNQLTFQLRRFPYMLRSHETHFNLSKRT